MTSAARDGLAPSSLLDLRMQSASEGPLRWRVDADDQELFVYVYLGDVTRVGLFVPTREPPPVGTKIDVTVAASLGSPLRLRGGVQWVNPWRPQGDNLNPGAGVLLEGLEAELREQLVGAVRTLVFLR